jgi:hypothetical protein
MTRSGSRVDGWLSKCIQPQDVGCPQVGAMRCAVLYCTAGSTFARAGSLQVWNSQCCRSSRNAGCIPLIVLVVCCYFSVFPVVLLPFLSCSNLLSVPLGFFNGRVLKVSPRVWGSWHVS